MLRAWRDKGVTKRELDWAKRYLVRSHAFAIDTAAKRVHQRLDEAVYDLPPGYHDEYVSRVRAVTLDEVNASVRNRISTENLLVTVVGTESQIGAAVREAIDDLASVEVVRYDADG
jgi:zinc protease